jgi:hypothetical protein
MERGRECNRARGGGSGHGLQCGLSAVVSIYSHPSDCDRDLAVELHEPGSQAQGQACGKKRGEIFREAVCSGGATTLFDGLNVEKHTSARPRVLF